MRRIGCWQIAACAVAVSLVAVMGVSTAFAGGVDTVTYKKIIKDRVKTHPARNPCTHAPGMLTMHINNAVFHLTVNDNGDWATGTVEGTVAFAPTDQSQPSYFGHITQWFGENDNLQNQTASFTFHANLRGSDGSRLAVHEVAHMSVSANGINSVSFDRPRLTCP